MRTAGRRIYGRAAPPRGAWLGVVVMLGTVAGWLAPPEVLACRGTPRPPMWGRTTVLGKAVPAVFPIAGAAAPITVLVPVAVFIGASGPPGLPCTPVATTVTLSMGCVPPPPFPPVVVGAATFPTPAPGPYFPLFVPITIPPGPARLCALTGTATTTWANGSTSTGTGDIEICIVDPAPGEPPDPSSDPRLDLQLLTPETQLAHPGDQREHNYRLINNDPNETVTITFTADSEQVARLPGGSPEPPGSGSGVYAIADPGAGDNFPIAFSEDLLTPPAPGNNYILDDGTQENTIGSDPDKGGLIWLNQFTAQPGQEIIDKISVAYGTGADGRTVSVLLYDDPNDDGDPSDAILVRKVDDIVATNENTGVFNEVLIPPTDMGPAGSSFFAGVVMQESLGSFPAAIDQTTDQLRSWFAEEVECNANVVNLTANLVPIQTISGVGFPGNWMVRANGRFDCPAPQWIDLPPDPTAFPVPQIAKSITLCPGETRRVKIAQRSWPMCPPGSGCEQRVRLQGTFSDGTDALACAAATMYADATVPPDFQCPDGGMTTTVQIQPPDGLDFLGFMPTHEIFQSTRLLGMNVVPDGGPPLVPLPPQPSILDPFLGRITVPNVAGFAAAAAAPQPSTRLPQPSTTVLAGVSAGPLSDGSASFSTLASTPSAGSALSASKQLPAPPAGGLREAPGVGGPVSPTGAGCQIPDQAGHGVGDTVGATSDLNPINAFRVADNFVTSFDGALFNLCWWGFYIDFAGPTDCGPGDSIDNFTATFYNDDAGGNLPGSVKAGPIPIILTNKFADGFVIPTGIGDIAEWQFEGSLLNPVPVTAGQCCWIEIVNNTTGACSWLWSTAPPGDGRAAQDGDPVDGYNAGDERDYDLAWCLNAPVEPDGCGIVTDCGNGILEPGEQCDPPDGVFCDTACQIITPPPCGETQFTQSLDQSVLAGNSVHCGAGGLHADNSYYRAFTLADHGLGPQFDVCSVEIGVETANAPSGTQPIEVRLYNTTDLLNLDAGTLIGSSAFLIPNTALTHVTLPVAGTTNTGQLTVEIFTPDGQVDGNSFFIGTNNLGQTGPSYITAADCGLLDPTDLVDIGFPDSHYVMNVNGIEGVPPAIFVDQFFDVVFQMQVFSKNPPIVSTLELLHTVPPPPVVEDTYFLIEARSQLSGAPIPPTLETFFETWAHVSVDGVTAGQHHSAVILQETVNALILAPDLLQVSFTGIFPFDPALPPAIETVVVHIDPGGNATGLFKPDPGDLCVVQPPCPEDLNNDGVVNAADLALLLGDWGPNPGSIADLNGDNVVNAADLALLLGAWGPC